MSEILFCNHRMSPEALQNQCGIDIDKISTFSCTKPSIAVANTPHLIGGNDSDINQIILSQLSPMPVARELTNLSLSYGGDNLIALSEITAKLQEYNIGLMGASTSVYANRMGGFAGSVKEYQSSLMEYRKAVTSHSVLKNTAKRKAYSAFQKMQIQFHNELKFITSQVKARRGTPLTSADRAINIARGSRNAAKLSITSQVQANNLVKFSRQAKFLGNGLAVIDFTSRVGIVHTNYQAGGNWERDLFIESSSFAASALTGTAVVNGGVAALSFLLVATPMGWIGLIVGGIAVAGVAAAASIEMNNSIKNNSGDWYDSIMKEMSFL